MKIKFNRNKTVSCKLVWKRRIVSEKGFSEKRAERIAQRCIDLIERMQYGNAMIAFYKQDGTFCMEKGTLVGYEKFFHREYKSTARQESSFMEKIYDREPARMESDCVTLIKEFEL